jgi:hypothetical protein
LEVFGSRSDSAAYGSDRSPSHLSASIRYRFSSPLKFRFRWNSQQGQAVLQSLHTPEHERKSSRGPATSGANREGSDRTDRTASHLERAGTSGRNKLVQCKLDTSTYRRPSFSIPKRSRQICQQRFWPRIAHHLPEGGFLRYHIFANEAAGAGYSAYWPWVQVLRSLVVYPDRTRARPPLVTPEIGELIPTALALVAAMVCPSC